MKKNFLFTLIELIAVIVVISILAAIVIPNISGFKEEATVASVHSNVKNLQTASDIYSLENNGELPVLEGVKPLSYLNPLPVDFEGLRPDFIRKSPKESGYRYWIDFKGTVWASKVDAPTNVKYDSNTGILTWDAMEEAESYRIYKVEGVVPASSAAKGAKARITFLQETIKSEATPSISSLPNGEYLVSSLDYQGFESPPAGADYLGYEIILKENGINTPVENTDSAGNNNGISKPKPIQTTVPDNWIPIYTIEDLEKLKNTQNYGSKFILMENLDFGTDPENRKVWTPIRSFAYTFDGNGLMIENLYITQSGDSYVGFISDLRPTGLVKNLEFRNATINTKFTVGTGIVAGSSYMGTIEDVKVSGRIESGGYVGGIVGNSNQATVQRNSATVQIISTGTRVGGLIGHSNRSNIFNNHTSGKVSGLSEVGGLVGVTYEDKLKYNYSTVENIGGGGVTGWTQLTYVDNIRYNYWDTEVSKTSIDSPRSPSPIIQAAGKTTSEMMRKETYEGFDFDTIWTIEEGKGYPQLR